MYRRRFLRNRLLFGMEQRRNRKEIVTRPRRYDVPEKYRYCNYEDNELRCFGIIVKRVPPPCPYNEKGEYVPRNKRR